jgi:hypothetical protein
MRTILIVLCAALLLAPAAALAHKGNPNYLSQINAISPAMPGLKVTVVNRDDRLLLQNTSGRDVIVEGYNGEPYARVAADGTVAVNTNSPAYYLNEERFATTQPPAGVDGKGEPKWKQLSGTGRFEWHDHRAHYMGKGIPQQVTDRDKRTKVFDWKVPLQIEGTQGQIAGTLFWTPQAGGGVPAGAIIAGAAIVIGLSLMVILVRRRRAAAADGAPAGDTTAEAW